MKKNKPSEWVQVEFLKALNRNGIERASALQQYSKRFKLNENGTRTFDNRWKIAKQAISAEQAMISAKVNEGVLKEIERRKGLIADVLERQEFLTSVQRGEKTEQQKKPVFNPDKKKFEIITTETTPAISDGIKAVAELNKMDGSYAPEKREHSGIITVSDTQFSIRKRGESNL